MSGDASSAPPLDLFISHSSADAGIARELRQFLQAAGYSCWMAPDDIKGPVSWAEQILAAIDGCRVMVVLVSSNANGSRHVSREVNLALARGKPILPVRVEAVPPTGALEYLLTLVQRVDAYPPPFRTHLEAIRAHLAAVLDAPESGSSISQQQTWPRGVSTHARRPWVWIAGVALGSLAVVAALLWAIRGGVGTDPLASPPPTLPNALVAWIETTELDGELIIKELDPGSPGAEPRRTGAMGVDPAWHPSGRWVTMATTDPVPGRRQNLTFVPVDPAGSPVEIEIPGLAEVGEPAWSPDGRRLAFWGEETAGGSRNIYIASHPAMLEALENDPARLSGSMQVCPLSVPDVGAEVMQRTHVEWLSTGERLVVAEARGPLAVAVGACDAPADPVPLDRALVWSGLGQTDDPNTVLAAATPPQTDAFQLFSVDLNGQVREYFPDRTARYVDISGSRGLVAWAARIGLDTTRIIVFDDNFEGSQPFVTEERHGTRGVAMPAILSLDP